MEHSPQPVPAKVAHDRIAMTFGVFLDCVCNISDVIARLRLLDTKHQAFVGQLDESPCLQGYLADIIHTASIAMPAVDNRRDVDIDDVAVPEWLIGGDAVTHDVIDARATAMRIAAIAKRCWNASSGEDHFAHFVVDCARGDIRLDKIDQSIENLSRESACFAHTLKARRIVQLDCATA